MSHLRDRRAFGNIGTRKFRGARFGDALSPRFSGLLDQYGGAAAAYSLRALSSGWLAGDVVEVRRSSDGTLQDFTASQITNGDLLTFTGAGDGFVSTWYDQSGNANNATQGTTTAQPKIVSAGALVVGGLDFDGVDDEFTITGMSSTFQNSQYAAAFTVVKYRSALSSTQPVFFAQAGATSGVARVYLGQVGTNFSSAGRRLDADGFAQSTSAISTSTSLLSGMSQWADGDTQLAVNGSEKTATNYSSGAGSTSNTTSDVVTIGSLTSSVIDGFVGELIVYASDQSANRAAIETNINDFYSIY